MSIIKFLVEWNNLPLVPGLVPECFLAFHFGLGILQTKKVESFEMPYMLINTNLPLETQMGLNLHHFSLLVLHHFVRIQRWGTKQRKPKINRQNNRKLEELQNLKNYVIFKRIDYWNNQIFYLVTCYQKTFLVLDLSSWQIQ